MKISAAVAPAFWGAVGGAIILAIIGFNWGGWVTASKAANMAQTKAQTAVVHALVPYCVDTFEHMPDAAAQWVKLKKTDEFDQDTFVEKAGVVSPPGSKLGSDTADAVASACADKLVALKQLGGTQVSLNK
ncbi:MAG: hypothetical protein M0015_04340 [Betaproteobacteria bacterium]|nr:hypothetical protein [Betaproteobacteria bacterium]